MEWPHSHIHTCTHMNTNPQAHIYKAPANNKKTTHNPSWALLGRKLNTCGGYRPWIHSAYISNVLWVVSIHRDRQSRGEEWKSQRMGRSTVKCCLPDMSIALVNSLQLQLPAQIQVHIPTGSTSWTQWVISQKRRGH